MTIDRNKLSPLFRPSSLRTKQDKDTLKVFKALFYTLRSYVWAEACRNMVADGKESQFLKWDDVEGCLITTDDLYDEENNLILPKGSIAAEWFNVEKPKFLREFDQTYVKATVEELSKELQDCYGISMKQALEENERRMAQRYNR